MTPATSYPTGTLNSSQTKARNLCSAHDAAGALGLVAQDRDWQQFPGVLTNPVDFAAGQPAVHRARPTFDYPADHAGNATPAVLSLYRQALDRHAAPSPMPLAYSQLRYWTASAITIGLNLSLHFTHCRYTPQRKSWMK
jgi:hypothetical protein